jgi:hypothetical protein
MKWTALMQHSLIDNGIYHLFYRGISVRILDNTSANHPDSSYITPSALWGSNAIDYEQQ